MWVFFAIKKESTHTLNQTADTKNKLVLYLVYREHMKINYKKLIAFKKLCILRNITSTDYTPMINVGLTRIVRHYQPGYIQSLEKITEKQNKVMQNKFDIENIVRSLTKKKTHTRS